MNFPNNLLTDPLFRVETSDGLIRLDLPGLLEAYGTDRVESLPGLQRHQEDAFHIFLCYLAGAVLARERQAEPRQTATFWREGIRRLTFADGGVDESAWMLVVADPTKPAFLQAPCPTTADFQTFKLKARTPDALDLLATAKNHDVKSIRATRPDPEDWIYALVSLQTMSGFFGRDNYGIARMYTGTGSRPIVAIDYTSRRGSRWRDHTIRLLELRAGLLQGVWHYRTDGLVCTWVSPWNLHTSLAINALDPFFIEMCRPIRLVDSGDYLHAMGTSSKTPRIAAKETNGNLGDPWIPINQKKLSALTVSANGLTPDLLRELIFEDGFILTPLQRPDPSRPGQSCHFTASVLVRGQGTTDGFHHVAVSIPGTVTWRLFQRSPERDGLASLSKTAIGDSGTMQNKVLKPAVLCLLEAGPKQVDLDKREINVWWNHTQRDFVAAWSADFFPWLWRTAENPDQEVARLAWLQALRVKAKVALENAITRYPIRTGRRFRAQIRAEGLFHGLLFKQFPSLKETTHDHASHD